MMMKTPILRFSAVAFLALGLSGVAGCAYDSEPERAAPAKRPLSAPARANPIGSGETLSVKIDNATGGTVALPNGTQLEVPPGALPPGVETIAITSSSEPAPAVYAAASPMYVFEPDGTVFLKPIKVSIPVTLPAGVTASELTLLWSRSQGNGYDMVPSTLSPIAGSATELLAVGEVTHFSTGFIGLKFTTDPNPTPDPYADK